MGRTLYDRFRVARETFEEADGVLGIALTQLCFEGPEEALRLTENTQPAVLTVSVAACRVITTETEIRPVAAAGHSLGEYSALVAAGVLTFADALRLVRVRARAMQAAVPDGAGCMQAVLGFDPNRLEELCREGSNGEVVSLANYNCPGQQVISGHVDAVDRVVRIAKEEGATGAVPLNVSAPFHSPLMRPAGQALAKAFDAVHLSEPGIDVVSNTDAEAYPGSGAVRDLLVRQVSSPVRWEDSMRRMIGEGIDRFIEVGPGQVLKGLMRRIDRHVKVDRFGTAEDLEPLKGKG